jgi:hypothetical protein
MGSAHSAWIFWSAEQATRGLPTVARAIDPAWFDDTQPGIGDGWSLVCDFDPPPSEQGDPTTAQVRFLVAEAPHDRLRPGVRLRLFERATNRYATVEILD